MSQASLNATAALPWRALRIVLFGMPQAGKSSLLGALAQAAQTQEHAFGAKLIDKSHGLMELQRRLYEDRPRETLEELVPYQVALEPFTAKNGDQASQQVEAVLFDCDGRAANELLARKDLLISEAGPRALARAIASADTLVLAVDVSTDGPGLKRDFAQFTQFLRTLERSRGQRTEVGGLPVYLVLTKCDLLAEASDTSAQWMDRIEERKREVHQRFQEFLAQQAAREQMPFGKIDLLVWATAVKRPALSDAPARPREPYGVAELFRQCVASAQAYRERRRLATHRLGWVVGILGVLVCFLALLGLFFLASRHEADYARYQRDLKAFRLDHNDGSAVRLQEPVDKTIRELKAFKDSALFYQIPTDEQEFIDDFLKEALVYEKYSKAVNDYLRKHDLPRWPRKARSAAVLDEMEAVPAQFPVPTQYQKAWADTEGVRRFRDWPDEIQVMRHEVATALSQLKVLREGAAKLRDQNWGTPKERTELRQKLSAKEDNFRYKEGNFQNIPDSQVTYNDIAEFESVREEQRLWQRDRADMAVNLDEFNKTPPK
jgi:GTPase SAR1 family protein